MNVQYLVLYWKIILKSGMYYDTEYSDSDAHVRTHAHKGKHKCKENLIITQNKTYLDEKSIQNHLCQSRQYLFLA